MLAQVLTDQANGGEPPSARRLMPAIRKRLRQWKQWGTKLFVELVQIDLAFWTQRSGGPHKDILLGASSLTLVLLARRTHAALDDPAASAKAFLLGAALSWFLAFSACLFDPRCRLNKFEYVKNARACYRIIALGLLLSALLVAGNHVWPWADAMGTRLHITTDFEERICVLATPAAFVSLFLLFILSLYQASFRRLLRDHPA
jgi:hypothetical protein